MKGKAGPHCLGANMIRSLNKLQRGGFLVLMRANQIQWTEAWNLTHLGHTEQYQKRCKFDSKDCFCSLHSNGATFCWVKPLVIFGSSKETRKVRVVCQYQAVFSLRQIALSVENGCERIHVDPHQYSVSRLQQWIWFGFSSPQGVNIDNFSEKRLTACCTEHKTHIYIYIYVYIYICIYIYIYIYI